MEGNWYDPGIVGEKPGKFIPPRLDQKLTHPAGEPGIPLVFEIQAEITNRPFIHPHRQGIIKAQRVPSTIDTTSLKVSMRANRQGATRARSSSCCGRTGEKAFSASRTEWTFNIVLLDTANQTRPGKDKLSKRLNTACDCQSENRVYLVPRLGLPALLQHLALPIRACFYAGLFPVTLPSSAVKWVLSRSRSSLRARASRDLTADGDRFITSPISA